MACLTYIYIRPFHPDCRYRLRYDGTLRFSLLLLRRLSAVVNHRVMSMHPLIKLYHAAVYLRPFISPSHSRVCHPCRCPRVSLQNRLRVYRGMWLNECGSRKLHCSFKQRRQIVEECLYLLLQRRAGLRFLLGYSAEKPVSR